MRAAAQQVAPHPRVGSRAPIKRRGGLPKFVNRCVVKARRTAPVLKDIEFPARCRQKIFTVCLEAARFEKKGIKLPFNHLHGGPGAAGATRLGIPRSW